MREQGRGLGNSLLEQQQGRLEHRLRHEPPLHRPIQEQEIQCEQAHALVMRHKRAHYGARLLALLPSRRVVDRFKEAEWADQSFGCESLKILAGLLGCHHQRQHRSIGRNHQILRKSSLETQARHAEGSVLVIEMGIDRVITGFRDSPGNAALLPVLDLSRDRRLVGLIEQRVVVGRHHHQRHQVLEHRAAPRQQHRFSKSAGKQAPQGEPDLLRRLSLGNDDETGQSRLRCQQVVVTRIEPVLAHVVADGQQMSRFVQ